MDKLFSRKEAADFLGVTVRTLKRWQASGKILPVVTVSHGDRQDKFYSQVQLSRFREKNHVTVTEDDREDDTMTNTNSTETQPTTADESTQSLDDKWQAVKSLFTEMTSASHALLAYDAGEPQGEQIDAYRHMPPLCKFVVKLIDALESEEALGRTFDDEHHFTELHLNEEDEEEIAAARLLDIANNFSSPVSLGSTSTTHDLCYCKFNRPGVGIFINWLLENKFVGSRIQKFLNSKGQGLTTDVFRLPYEKVYDSRPTEKDPAEAKPAHASFKQLIENLPDELLTQPRFFAVTEKKDPIVTGWSNPANQSLPALVTGIKGFDIVGHDRADDYFLADFDYIFDDDGNFVCDLAERWVNYLLSAETYCELSISNHGLHFPFKPTPNKFPTLAGNSNCTIFLDDKNHTKDSPKIELYYKTGGRYFLFTGNVYKCDPKTPIVSGEIADEFVQHLVNELPLQETVAPVENNYDVSAAPLSADELKKLLTFLPCADATKITRNDWWLVGAIIEYEYGDEGFEIWRAWSETDQARYSLDVCKKTWADAVKRHKRGLGKPAKIGTLIWMAKQYGYQPPLNIPAELELTAEQCKKLFTGNLSDLQNGDRIAYLYGDLFKFVTDHAEWMIFADGVWRASAESSSAIYPFARKLQRRLLANARDKKEKAFGSVFDSVKKTDAAIRILRGNPDIRISSKDLDTHNNLLNCLNGVVDLETGKFYDAAPELLITRQVNAVYRPDFHNETVDKFLRDIMPDDRDLDALIRWLGYCLTGEICEQCAFFWTGDGSNGKSTLLELILNLMATYAIRLSVKAVVESREAEANAATPHLAVLTGARFAVVNEFKPYHRLDLQRFKELTGDGGLVVRRLHKEQETINLTAKLVLNGNELPRLDNNQSYALRRRIRALRFKQTFSAELNNLDMKLPKKLAAADALSGMLTILAKAAQAWYRDGLLESDSMKTAKTDYLNENDFIEEFISDYCIFRSDASIKRKDFVEQLKQKFPYETMPNRIRTRDLIKLITNKLEQHGVISTLNSHAKFYEFKGVGWLGEPLSDTFEGEPIDPNDTPF